MRYTEKWPVLYDVAWGTWKETRKLCSFTRISCEKPEKPPDNLPTSRDRNHTSSLKSSEKREGCILSRAAFSNITCNPRVEGDNGISLCSPSDATLPARYCCEKCTFFAVSKINFQAYFSPRHAKQGIFEPLRENHPPPKWEV